MSDKIYFPHIDGLRAVAVLAVIIFHIDEEILPGGYLGVDLFFVISGFVITGYLMRMETANITKSLMRFYVRRLMRLMPALITVIILGSFLFLLLANRPSEDIFRTASTAIFGLSNNYLYWSSADYFSLDATLNPFTHTWSLGVEEQFYLIYPAILVSLGLITKNRHNTKNRQLLYFVLSLIWFTSFFGYIIIGHIDKMAAFYLLPFRLWELGVGCFAYYIYTKNIHKQRKSRKIRLSILSLIAICFCFYIPEQHQSYSTIALVFFSIFIIIDNDEKSIINRILSLPVMIWVGLLSYSFYIWHWPILVLAKYTIGNQGIPLFITITVFFTVSIISYYLIERPFRYAKSKVAKWKISAAYIAVMSFVAITIAIQAPKYAQSYNNVLADIFSIPPTISWVEDVDCHGWSDLNKKSNPLEDCLGASRTEEKPNIIYLVGDSHAAQLYFYV